MIANAAKRPVEHTKNHCSIMLTSPGFAVHRFWCAHDLPAKSLAKRLMTQTNAKDRNGWRRGGNEFEANPGIAGPTRTGRQHDGIRRSFQDLGHAHAIISMDPDFGAETAEAVHQVPGKTVVIVNQRYGSHCGLSSFHAVLGFVCCEVKINGVRTWLSAMTGCKRGRLSQLILNGRRSVTSFQ